MEPLNIAWLPEGALLLLDSPPIIYVLEQHSHLAPRFLPLFEAQAARQLSFAVTTTAVAEVLIGPFQSGDEALARRYRTIFDSWQVVPLDAEIAEGAARLRASLHLKLPDAIQAASAAAINATALVTYDRDFSRLRSLRIIS